MHKSVLLQTSIEGLDIRKGDIFLDGTLGGGGHSEEVCNIFGQNVKVIGIDLDRAALKASEDKLSKLKCDFILKEGSFRNLDKILDQIEIPRVNRILLDIGLSSDQFEKSGRGFSFQKDEPLIMTFKENPTKEDITARDILNDWAEENILQVIKSYGEERFGKRIARKIVERRQKKPIETTYELVGIIKEATPKFYHHMRIHPATKTFQALRIVVNDEIRALKEGLEKGFERLEKGGRMAVISFHSLEDRIVKNYFRQLNDEEKANIVTKKPIVPSFEEISMNPRARSAKLRILSKL